MWEESCQKKQKNSTTEVNISCYSLFSDGFNWDIKLLIKHSDLCMYMCVYSHEHVHTHKHTDTYIHAHAYTHKLKSLTPNDYYQIF